jgi:small-conductance mechanosensitive channel
MRSLKNKAVIFKKKSLLFGLLLVVLPVLLLAQNNVTPNHNQDSSETQSIDAPAEETEPAEASGSMTILDISQLKESPFTLKKKGFEETGQKLGNKVDNLGKNMVSSRTEWLNSEAAWGISYLKLLISLLSFLALLLGQFLLRKLILRSQKKYELHGRSLRELAERSHNWFDPMFEAFYPPFALFIWVYGGLTIVSFLFSHTSSNDQIFWFPQTIGQLAEIGGFAAFFWTFFRFAYLLDVKLKVWATKTPSQWDNILVPFVGKCLRLILPLLAIIFSLPFFKLSPAVSEFIQKIVSVVIIASISWILVQLVLVVEMVIIGKNAKNRKEDLRARKIFTQVHILKKVLLTVIWIFSFSLMLMVFDSVRQLGTSIMASAGVIGIIVGLAAQKTIATLLAGIQIAITQPVRIDDVVIVEGEWGWVEEITLTYVVVKIWDLRRLVLPINYFIEKPFQNWTRTSSKILGSVYFYVDYSFPVDKLLEPLKSIVSASPDWDGDVCGLAVTDTKPTYVELRALVSADDSSKAWNLRCEVRKKVLSYIQKNYPGSLPMVRAHLDPKSLNK